MYGGYELFKPPENDSFTVIGADGRCHSRRYMCTATRNDALLLPSCRRLARLYCPLPTAHRLPPTAHPL